MPFPGVNAFKNWISRGLRRRDRVTPEAAARTGLSSAEAVDDREVWGGLLWAMEAATTEDFEARMAQIRQHLEASAPRSAAFRA